MGHLCLNEKSWDTGRKRNRESRSFLTGFEIAKAGCYVTGKGPRTGKQITADVGIPNIKHGIMTDCKLLLPGFDTPLVSRVTFSRPRVYCMAILAVITRESPFL